MRGRFRRYTPWAAGIAVLAVIGAVVGYLVVPGTPTRTIYAQFVEAPGLYPGNHVDVLGIPVGTVDSIKVEADYVLVKMSIPKSLELPAGEGAVLMAPEVVADRFVQLQPPYASGPTMTGRTIPLEQTAIPQSVDQVIYQLNRLAEQLGPNGANKNGALTDLVHQLATSFGGSGPDFHAAVVNFSQALEGLSQNSPALAGTLNNLGNLSQALANNSSTYQSFAQNLDAVSGVLSSDRQDVSAVLQSLQQLFSNLTSFIQADGANLGSSIKNLDTFAQTLASEQAALAQAYDLTPLALQNLDNAIDKNAPGGPALRGRYDPVSNSQTLFNQVCGSTAIRFLVILASGTQTNPLTQATPVDTLCGIGNALNALTPPPNAAAGPNLSLTALVP